MTLLQYPAALGNLACNIHSFDLVYKFLCKNLCKNLYHCICTARKLEKLEELRLHHFTDIKIQSYPDNSNCQRKPKLVPVIGVSSYGVSKKRPRTRDQRSFMLTPVFL